MMVPGNFNVVHTHANYIEPRCKDNPKLAWSFLHCFEIKQVGNFEKKLSIHIPK